MTHFEIEAFFAIINTGSISKAAELLSISQSALSRRIFILEEELGYPLFNRSRGIKQTLLTSYGKEFLPLAEQYQAIYGKALSLRSHKGRRELRISAPDSLNRTVLKNAYSAFMKEYPEIKLSIHTNRSEESYRYMEEGSIDIAYVGLLRPSKTITCDSFFTEKVVFACSKNATYSDYVTIKDLSIEKCIRFNFNIESTSWFEKNFQNDDMFFTYVDNLSLYSKELFEDDHWTIIPYYISQILISDFDLTTKAIESPPADRRLYSIYRVHNPNNDLVKLFETFIQKYLSEQYEIKFFSH